jgi:two-component system, chemotaxis family, CheB/CheR fusion protein
MVQSASLIVGIGASAGGLAAFKNFLAHTPADSGMAFVLVQHLDPRHKSLLVELLGTSSPIPVVAASDGAAVRKNHVYVIPPNATLTIREGLLRVATPAPARESRRPIDTFFASLAQNSGERAVGIVLAGVGSDGTIGIRAIKENGGLTLAQAEFDATALPGMPSSAASTGLVDQVVLVEAMPAELVGYDRHLNDVADKKDGNGHRKDVEQHLQEITSVLHAGSEHDFSGYKEPTLVRRLQRRMQVLQIDNATGYVERLKADSGEVDALFRDLLIGVTQFFRDPSAFDALKLTAIAPLLTATGNDRPIRIWVPGCSTGEEVYSIAILVREALHDARMPREVIIFGTDIDANAVAMARTARYREPLSGLSAERFDKWFAKVGETYSPMPEIRDMCVFSTHSLIKDPPFSRLDLISCRNVLIYLGQDLQNLIMRNFHYALLPDAYLFLGPSESVTRNSKLFSTLDKKHRILQRQDVDAGILPMFHRSTTSATPQPAPRPVRQQVGEDRIDRSVRRVMEHYAPAYFVIDSNNEILRFSGAETGPYLEPSAGAASFGLFSIVQKALRPAVRAAVRKALAEKHTIVNENLTIRIDGKARALTLIVEPVGSENGAAAGGTCVVAFRHSSPPALQGESEPRAENAAAGEQDSEHEVRALKAQLRVASDELEMRAQDMKSTTEEYQAVNEELQSSNEELETAKEEMQSVNEELQTVNNEMQSKNEMLSRLNSDLQNLLDSTQIATVFLDDKMQIRHFTPSVMSLFPMREGDVGRPITDIVHQLDYHTLQADLEGVQRDGSVVERDLVLKDGAHSFVMRMNPYRTIQGGIDGIVVTFVDITHRKAQEERQKLLSNELEHRTNNLLAVVMSVVHQSLAGTPALDDARNRLTARLHAIAKANLLLTGGGWQGASVRQVIDHELNIFKGHVSIEGPEVVLTANATQSFALVIHELATNAAKYGALSVPTGKIAVHWSIEGVEPSLMFKWQEEGGPGVTAPMRAGFGTTLLKAAFQEGSAPRIEYSPSGLIYTLEVPLSAVAIQPG